MGEQDFQPGEVAFVFDRPPGPDCILLEVKDSTGASINIGRWVQVGDVWHLRVRAVNTKPGEIVLTLDEARVREYTQMGPFELAMYVQQCLRRQSNIDLHQKNS